MSVLYERENFTLRFKPMNIIGYNLYHLALVINYIWLRFKTVGKTSMLKLINNNCFTFRLFFALNMQCVYVRVKTKRHFLKSYF